MPRGHGRLSCVAVLLGVAVAGVLLRARRSAPIGLRRSVYCALSGRSAGRARRSARRSHQRVPDAGAAARPALDRRAFPPRCARRPSSWSWSISAAPRRASTPRLRPPRDAPERVLPFYPAFLAGMNLVVLADDAFTFLSRWEFMSLASWALVMAHHRERDNARAGFIYLVMASFGTLALLLAFGLLAGPDGGYAFAAMRARSTSRRRSRRWCSVLVTARRRLEGRARAAACLAAARPSGGAQPCLGADERRHDQGRGLRLHPHRLRSARARRAGGGA